MADKKQKLEAKTAKYGRLNDYLIKHIEMNASELFPELAPSADEYWVLNISSFISKIDGTKTKILEFYFEVMSYMEELGYTILYGPKVHLEPFRLEVISL